MNDEMKQLYENISEDAIQRTSGKITGKGYDTTGYGYQYAVDRFNEVYGYQWGYSYHVVHHETGQYKNGGMYHDITVDVGIWIKEAGNIRTAPGGHRSGTYADALKGAMTNGFKKCAAFWGVGSAAYRGTLDDDNAPGNGSIEHPVKLKSEAGDIISDLKEKGDFGKAARAVESAENMDMLKKIKTMFAARWWNSEELAKLDILWREKSDALKEAK